MDNPWATDPWQVEPAAPVPPSDSPDDVWGAAWGTAPSSKPVPHPPDEWEAAHQESETPNHTEPPEWLEALLRHCEQVSQEVWPPSESTSAGNWRSGFDDLADITELLAQLAPTDPSLPPTIQFSATATAKAMNEALKLTRHLQASANSPLSRLLATKGSLEWQKSIKTTQETVPDMSRVGWRILDREDRLSVAEEAKPKKNTGGFLSFWNRRASGIQVASAETSGERPSSPARSSQEGAKSVPHPPSSPPVSSPNAPTPSVLSPPSTGSYPTVVAAAPAPSAVSRFLNRFSLLRGAQHGVLALSSDDLEFLSDIVPSASDEDINDGTPDALTNANSSSSLPPKLPLPIPPPPKHPIPSSRSSSTLVLGTLNGASVIGGAPTALKTEGVNHMPNIPVLAPPLSPNPATALPHTQNPSLKDVAMPTVALGQSSTPSMQQRSQSSPQLNLQPQLSLSLSPAQKGPSLSIPPLPPPPHVSPPQTPRPSAFSMVAPGHASSMQHSDTSDSYEFDDEFTAFTSFPPPPPPPPPAPAPVPPSGSYPPQRSPTPPSPPPRRTYERTHYPSSSSTSSTLSPASQSSADQLYSTEPSVSASLDSFDDFVSSPSVVRENRKHTPSPPPLPAKPQWQHRQPSRIDTYPPRVRHVHTTSQTSASPTVHTSLMTNMFSAPSVSDTERQRAQALVNHAAARGGFLWPNSPVSDEPGEKMILPPPSSSTPPQSLGGKESFDLLGDGDGLEVIPAPLGTVGGVGVGPVGASRARSGVAGGLGKGHGLQNQPQPTPPPLPTTSTSTLSSSSLGGAASVGPLQLTKPKQMGGLSAQDLSFFEGL